MGVEMLFKYLSVLAGLAAIVGGLKVFYIFRSRAMRDLAAKWGLRYIGPAAPKWWNPSHPKISPPLPAYFSVACPPGRPFRQVWNVIEGQQDGVPVRIFDSVVGAYKGGAPCTYIACQTEQNPFGMLASSDRVTQKHGWTFLYGVWFLFFSWTMGIRRLDNHLSKLRGGRLT